MDTISDYALSKANINLLKVYALNKILKEKPGMDKDLIFAAFDFFALDIIHDEAHKVSSWTPTTENISEINIKVWSVLKEKMLAFLDSRSLDPQKKINELFDSTMSRPQYSQEQESFMYERENIALNLKKNH
jgi:hypothetical protein